jgi:protein-arginine kinase activator protein McsA
VCKVHGVSAAADTAAAERRARAQRLARLRAELDQAVRAEQYEQAAKLRDELRAMGERPPQDPA